MCHGHWQTGTMVAIGQEGDTDRLAGTKHTHTRIKDHQMTKPTLMIASLLIAVLTGTAIGKIKRAKPIRHNLQAVEVPRRWYNKLASVEIAAALGLIVGLFVPPLGILTSLCVVLYFGGAVLAHIRTKDPNVVPSGFFMVLSGILASRLADEHLQYKAHGTSHTGSSRAGSMEQGVPPSIH
jgi:uncharacterized membrane protein YiaA